jgi:uncharacterized protein YcaQ
MHCAKQRNKTYPNEFDNKQIKQCLAKLIVAKTHTCGNTHLQKKQKKINKWWKLKPSTLFLL